MSEGPVLMPSCLEKAFSTLETRHSSIYCPQERTHRAFIFSESFQFDQQSTFAKFDIISCELHNTRPLLRRKFELHLICEILVFLWLWPLKGGYAPCLSPQTHWVFKFLLKNHKAVRLRCPRLFQLWKIANGTESSEIERQEESFTKFCNTHKKVGSSFQFMGRLGWLYNLSVSAGGLFLRGISY